jgi:hypothetical protein
MDAKIIAVVAVVALGAGAYFLLRSPAVVIAPTNPAGGANPSDPLQVLAGSVAGSTGVAAAQLGEQVVGQIGKTITSAGQDINNAVNGAIQTGENVINSAGQDVAGAWNQGVQFISNIF